MPSAEVGSFESQTIPSSTSSPARWASIASGRTPAPTTTASHSIARPLLVSTALTRPSPSKASSSSPPWTVTPWSSSRLLEPAPGVLAEGPRERHVLHHHDRALDALRGQRGGDLGADVAAADQDHVLGRLGVGADRVGVAEGAQVVDALVLGPLDPQDVDHRPGGEQRLAEADLLPALQLRRARRRVERHHVARSAARPRSPRTSRAG